MRPRHLGLRQPSGGCAPSPNLRVRSSGRVRRRGRAVPCRDGANSRLTSLVGNNSDLGAPRPRATGRPVFRVCDLRNAPRGTWIGDRVHARRADISAPRRRTSGHCANRRFHENRAASRSERATGGARCGDARHRTDRSGDPLVHRAPAQGREQRSVRRCGARARHPWRRGRRHDRHLPPPEERRPSKQRCMDSAEGLQRWHHHRPRLPRNRGGAGFCIR